MPFYFPRKNNNSKLVLVEIKKEVHLVKRLKAKILVGNDILVPKGFVLELSNKEAIILSCNTKIRILIKPQSQFISKRVLVVKNVVISPWTDTSIKVNLVIPSDRDFIFFPTKYLAVTFYYHIINAKTNKIFAQNNSSSIICIPRQTSLRSVSKIEYGNYFLISDYGLAMKRPH